MSRLKKGAAIVAVAAVIAAPMTMKWEGVSLRVYKDRLAHNIPTYCFGETENADFNKTYTIKECGDLLKKRLPQYAEAIAPCLNDDISEKTFAAFVVTSYNIGPKAFCASSMAKRFNAGDKRGACDALLSWTKSGGQFRQGLMNRRQDERRLCLQGLE